MTDEEWRGGLAEELDFLQSEKPDNPAMLESVNFWIFANDGSIAFPRVDVESIGETSDHHNVQLNAAIADGRRLFDPQHQYENHSPFGADGKPRVLGAGPLRMELVEPFRKWRLLYDGETVETTIDGLLDETVDLAVKEFDGLKRTPLKIDLDLEMAAPCWVQDNSEEKIRHLVARAREDAGMMGIGWRLEQLFRGTGTYTLDGKTNDLDCIGLRIRRRSRRPLGGFRGHCWQSAIFPNGDGFGYCTYPPSEDGTTFNEGYVYRDGKFYPAVAKTIPWFCEKIAQDEDVTLELESELGVTRIAARSAFQIFKHFTFGPGTFHFNQGGARYEWDGQNAYGMMERSYYQPGGKD